MKDRYDNICSTTSPKAVAHYDAAVRSISIAQHGAKELLQASIEEDPEFALAHALLAHTYSMMSQADEARQSLALAESFSDAASFREQAHVMIISSMINGDNVRAYKIAMEHLVSFPRDLVIALSTNGAFGLIGFSGRSGREAENLALMEQLAPHYVGDSWFNSQYAFAITEAGNPDRARPIAALAIQIDADNADAIHTIAHLEYETGNSAAGLSQLEQWRSNYHREGILHGHLAWHCALWALELGNFGRAMEILETDIHPNSSLSPPINVITDYIGFLIRAELAGHPLSSERWLAACDLLLNLFPEPGISFVDAHAAIAFAKTEDLDHLAAYRKTHKGYASVQVSRVANAFKAYINRDWKSVVDYLTPVTREHEQLGGSRAQRDLVEAVYIHALVQLNRTDDALLGKQLRRGRINNGIFALR